MLKVIIRRHFIVTIWLLITIRTINCTSNNDNNTYDIFSCCSEVFGSCRTTCENLSLVQLAVDSTGKEAKIAEIKRFCPSIQIDFWHCMNRTLNAVAKGSQWSGRLCCPLALSPRCQNACATSMSKDELSHGCRQSDEQNLYSCFERQEIGDDCCGNARTSECLQSCREIFKSRQTPSKELRNHVEKVCNDNNTNSKVLLCVKNFTELTPISNSKQYLPCCEYGQNSECKEACKYFLSIGETTQEMIDGIEKGGCGPPLPHNPLWQCFMSAGQRILLPPSSNDISQINQIGMDSAKLHCCHKAYAPKCRRLCIQTYSNDWTETRGDFEIDCLIGQTKEIALRQCLDEVDEPCELGCEGLGFCTNFNNRPTELFRSCNIQSDNAAKADVTLWKEKKFLSLPGLNLPIKDIAKCLPETWQAIACALQIKPCTRRKHSTQICREDCYQILSDCIDWTNLFGSHTASSICSKLSVDDINEPCISLKPYVEASESPYSGNHEVVTPCKGHPCNVTEVCQIDNNNNQTLYKCVTGCSLGETSSYMVPHGAYVRIPISLKQKGCLKICRCGASGKIEHCQPLPCISYDSCIMAGRKIDHATWFYVECNICSCFAGEITCTKKQCRIPGISDRSYTSLPCNCPPHHVPVCGKNGNTYPSACVAKCTGLHDSDIEFGSCRNRNPCDHIKCPAYSKCVENRQVCLSVMHRPCQQYQCVNVTTNCQMTSEKACGMNGITYPSVCHLLKSKTTLNYRGPCLSHCNNTYGPVCGINGLTYKSECETWSDYLIIDYYGECKVFGLITDQLGNRCSAINCKPLSHEKCYKIYPPGACCPVCSGAIRIVYSRKQIDRAIYALKGRNSDALTLRAVLKSLSELIRLAKCQLYGYLTVETDLFVGVRSTIDRPNIIQIDACIQEIEKIGTLITSQSHRITSDLALSAMTVANTVPLSHTNGVGTVKTDIFLGTLFIAIINYIILYYYKI